MNQSRCEVVHKVTQLQFKKHFIEAAQTIRKKNEVKMLFSGTKLN